MDIRAQQYARLLDHAHAEALARSRLFIGYRRLTTVALVRIRDAQDECERDRCARVVGYLARRLAREQTRLDEVFSHFQDGAQGSAHPA